MAAIDASGDFSAFVHSANYTSFRKFFPHLTFRKIPVVDIPHSAIRIPQSILALIKRIYFSLIVFPVITFLYYNVTSFMLTLN